MQVVENWNSANKDLFYGKDGDLAGTDMEAREVSMLAQSGPRGSPTRTRTVVSSWT
ncbi:hypothetical protein [Streptomyces sp. HUAS ZL42]|uniref:hypothetical protein n=1 Tax=Streptomyces sp. HUAS ZL42 TaxID=3231715 RepID=UPI00345E374E